VIEPRFYAHNNRPIRLRELPDGSVTAEGFDLATGAFVEEPGAFALVSDHGKDIDSFSARDFDFRVGELRTQIPIQWERSGNGEFPYGLTVGDERWEVRVNDFPAEPLYTLLADGRELIDLDDWPEVWRRP
jgi:hypothetical protein